MACSGDIRDFFHYLAGTLVRADGEAGFNVVVNESVPCECESVIGCNVGAALSQGFGADDCGKAALLFTRCWDDCWVLVKDDKVITSFSGDLIKFC